MIEFPPRLAALASRMRERLQEGLETNLYYHGVHHTFYDVLSAVDRICRGEGVVAIDRELLLAAAIFHDVGFLERYNGNESIGARYAAEALPQHGFSSHEIERVLDLILATEMREVDGVMLQVPGADALKRILCDADLDNLGREDFFQVSDNLRREIEERGRRLTDIEWYSRQVLFVSQHRWFTETQIRDRQVRKDENLDAIRSILAKAAMGGR